MYQLRFDKDDTMMFVKWYKRKCMGEDVFVPGVGDPVIQNCGLLRLTVNHLPRVGDSRGISNTRVRRRSNRLKVYVHDGRNMTDQFVLDQSVIELGLQQC